MNERKKRYKARRGINLIIPVILFFSINSSAFLFATSKALVLISVAVISTLYTYFFI